jgi:hypothetical protein
MSKPDELQRIYESYINGQFKQMVQGIQDYGLYDFWSDYRDLVRELARTPFKDFSETTVIYFRLTDR